MESQGTKQTEQGQVSSPAEPKDENHNIYTEDEKDLAARYKVEPKLIRMIAEIVGEHTEGINQLIGLMRGKQEPQDSQEPSPTYQQAETQEQPEGLCIDQQTQGRIKDFYKSLSPKTKLAIVTLSEIQCLDGINFQISKKEGRLMDEVWDDLQSVCIETYHSEPDDVIDVAIGIIDKEDIWLAGVWEAVRMVTQNC